MDSIAARLPKPIAHVSNCGLQSEWLTFEVQQSTPQQQEARIQTQLANPPIDNGLLEGDYLPSLLAAAPDQRVLSTFVKYLHAQDPMVAGMAASGLERFPLSEVIPAIIASVQKDGPSDAIAGFATYHRGWTLKDEDTIVHAVIPYLRPPDVIPAHNQVLPPYAPTPLSAAIKLLHFIFYIPNHAWPENADLAKYADTQVLLAAPTIMTKGNENAVQELAEYLGSIQPSDRAHSLLLQIAQRTDNAGKQAQICLGWHRPQSSPGPLSR